MVFNKKGNKREWERQAGGKTTHPDLAESF